MMNTIVNDETNSVVNVALVTIIVRIEEMIDEAETIGLTGTAFIQFK